MLATAWSRASSLVRQYLTLFILSTITTIRRQIPCILRIFVSIRGMKVLHGDRFVLIFETNTITSFVLCLGYHLGAHKDRVTFSYLYHHQVCSSRTNPDQDIVLMNWWNLKRGHVDFWSLFCSPESFHMDKMKTSNKLYWVKKTSIDGPVGLEFSRPQDDVVELLYTRYPPRVGPLFRLLLLLGWLKETKVMKRWITYR
jgi:hypothetical protein